MSIYGTAFQFCVEAPDDRMHEVVVQVVPAWIVYVGPSWEWLPPPRLGVDENEGYMHPRAAFFVTPETMKGTERNGQEYVNPLLVLTGEEWERMPFHEVMDKLERALAAQEPK